MEFLNEFMLPVVVGICLCTGFIVKKWVLDVDNKYIPTIVAVLGVVTASWISGWVFTPQVVLSGLISGLASTGMHQLLKQYIEGNHGADMHLTYYKAQPQAAMSLALSNTGIIEMTITCNLLADDEDRIYDMAIIG